jgi:hypothetical protein
VLKLWGRVNSINVRKVLWMLDVKRSHLPRLASYHQRLKQRPAFQRHIMNPLT